MKKIKVAVISKNFRINGISNVIMNYCLNLNTDKFDITVFSGPPIVEEYVKKLEDKDIKFVELPQKNKKNFLNYYKFLAKNINKNRFDIVHIHGNSSTMLFELLIAKINGIKVRITHCHSLSTYNQKLHKLLKPFFQKNYTFGFACSAEAGKWLYGNKPFKVLSNCFDTKAFEFSEKNRRAVRKELGLSDKHIIGHVGIFSNEKNHEFMINLFEKIGKLDKDAYLLFVGGGQNLEKMKDLASKNPFHDRIVFYGETTDVNKMYDAMDLFLFPSKSEGLGIVLLEAQLKGLNCIASDVIPKAAVINKENVDFLSLDSKLNVWAKKSLNYTSVDERKQYFLKNMNLIKKYDINQNVRELENLYIELCQKIK